MIEFGVNLKRFDVPAKNGGICQMDDSIKWIEDIVESCVSLGLGSQDEVRIRLFPPESLLLTAEKKLVQFPAKDRKNLFIGSQVIFRDDVKKEGNFGAFTANLPAAAVDSMGIRTTLLGHSEERGDKFNQLLAYDSEIANNSDRLKQANRSVNRLVSQEMKQALSRGFSVMFCVGETAEEKGNGSQKEQEERIYQVLYDQLYTVFEGLSFSDNSFDIVIAYEPRWAIGPGKVPPGTDYIRFVSKMIKDICKQITGHQFSVLYGGGLKRENAAEVASVPTIDGGLVALTKFTTPIGFDTDEFKVIMELFLQEKNS